MEKMNIVKWHKREVIFQVLYRTLELFYSLNRVPTHLTYPIQLFTRNLHTGNHILYDREHTALFDLKISPKSSVTRTERNVEIREIFKSKSAVYSWQ